MVSATAIPKERPGPLVSGILSAFDVFGGMGTLPVVSSSVHRDRLRAIAQRTTEEAFQLDVQALRHDWERAIGASGLPKP